MRRTLLLFLLLATGILVLVLLNLFIGSVDIPMGAICSILMGN